MIKRILFLFLFLLQAGIALCQSYNSKYGSPIIVLTERDPWLMVIGSDAPSFALYENGQIIYRKETNNRVNYYEVKLSREQVQKEILALGISDSLLKAPKYIFATHATDQPTYELILNFDSVRTKTVYGYLRGPDRAKIPGYFLSVYDKIKKFNVDTGKTWLPDSIEVMLTGYSYAPEKSLQWPMQWPNLKSRTTIKRDDDLYSIYLDKKYFDQFLKLMKSMKEKQAVKINGQKFSISYRLPFPNLR